MSVSVFCAHSDPQNPNDLSQWEPLFTPDCPALSGERCEPCERMDRKHGHLNKVAWWTGKFTEEMFRNGSLEAEAAREWGYIATMLHPGRQMNGGLMTSSFRKYF